MIPADFRAIGEANLFKAVADDIARLKTGVDFVLEIAVHFPGIVRPIGKKVASWWMMRSLFEENFRAILPLALVGLTEDRV